VSTRLLLFGNDEIIASWNPDEITDENIATQLRQRDGDEELVPELVDALEGLLRHIWFFRKTLAVTTRENKPCELVRPTFSVNIDIIRAPSREIGSTP
jgi:hypothetical protein